jgi:hypothetical protein
MSVEVSMDWDPTGTDACQFAVANPVVWCAWRKPRIGLSGDCRQITAASAKQEPQE